MDDLKIEEMKKKMYDLIEDYKNEIYLDYFQKYFTLKEIKITDRFISDSGTAYFTLEIDKPHYSSHITICFEEHHNSMIKLKYNKNSKLATIDIYEAITSTNIWRELFFNKE